MGFILKISISLILAGVVAFFTGNVVIAGISFIIFLILGLILFRKRKFRSKEEYMYNKELRKMVKAGTITPEQARTIFKNKQKAAA